MVAKETCDDTEAPKRSQLEHQSEASKVFADLPSVSFGNVCLSLFLAVT